MAKSLPSPTRFQQFAKLVFSSKNPQSPPKKSRIRASPSETPISGSVRVILEPNKNKYMEEKEKNRTPLSDVVSDCVKRWFQDTLKEAKAGDTSMQVLVGQMFCSGYGVPKNTKKVLENVGNFGMKFIGEFHPAERMLGIAFETFTVQITLKHV
ncbi:uncharacterized protein E5676_scaffold436G00560 [Cucumis melo var. makuwa]|uniref:Uncharacterized protein n=1 Tax=Cucumis melo var. makuwa TaxID=1194695 RepID=A0A5D3DQA2_CUCMM|nr:uncharacterized protein E5676_scaffold436G00560 [Cucumis melo var. makuwa]